MVEMKPKPQASSSCSHYWENSDCGKCEKIRGILREGEGLVALAPYTNSNFTSAFPSFSLEESSEKVRIRNQIREFFGFGFALQNDYDNISARTPVKHCSGLTYDTCL